MKILVYSIALILLFNLHAQKLEMRVGLGANITDQELSANHSLESMVFFLEPSIALSEKAHIHYSIEPGVKFAGEVIQTSLPPQKFGANYLLNQYLKYLHHLGRGRIYIGSGYLLHFQRPYRTNFGDEGQVLSTERFNQTGHGVSIYAGSHLGRMTFETSFHYMFGTFNNFAGIKLGYKIL